MASEGQWNASHKFARTSARKARLVIDTIRGRGCADALELLRFNRRRASSLISAVLKSAMASADEQEADMRSLFIHEARVDAGPTYARWRPKDRGRAHPILKPSSHIIIGVAERK